MTPRAGFRWEWERRFRDSPLERGPKLAGLVMATFGDANGNDIYPSTDRLARACDMNPKTVRKHRDELVAAGWFECLYGSGGRGQGNKYRLTLPLESIPTLGRLSEDSKPRDFLRNLGKRSPETLPTDGRVFDLFDPETLPRTARKPSQEPPLNPPNGWDPTRADQTMDQKNVSAGSAIEGSSAPGLERVAVSKHRHLPDARDGADADAARQLEDEAQENTTSAADVGRLVSGLARNARLP